MSARFDHVVIGGGSSGSIAAARLAEDPDVRVLVLEAGPAAEEHPETLRADGYKDAFVNDAVIWERFSTPQAHLGQQRVFMGSGTVTGGSGSVNGMVYTRGDVADYAEWPEGWRWADLEPEFAAVEAVLRPNRRPPTRFTEACISAAVAQGFARSEDLNDGRLAGKIGYEWMTYEGDRRRSSYVAFIQDAPPRPNLVIETHARVHRIVLDEHKRAIAVEFSQRGVRRRVEVAREVVMCAGALETPKLLMLSGIGADQALRFAGIAPVHVLEGVGQNLHDHPNVPLFFLGDRQVDCHYPQLYSFHRTHPASDLPAGQADTCYVFWPAPSAMKEAVQRMLPGKVLPERLYGSPLKGVVRSAVGRAFGLESVQKLVDRLFGIIVILGKPRSRGSVRLQSSDPEAPAVLDPAYASDPRDMQTLVAGVRQARALARSGGLRAWHSRELMPGPFVSTDAQIARFVATNAITTYHFAGTCRMGSDPLAVCDTRLRLRGVQNIRIADASAIPFTPVSALNAPSMLIGYRAARFIREDEADARSRKAG